MSSAYLPTLMANSTIALSEEYYVVAAISKFSGVLSLAVWLFAQLPQVFENYLNHSVSGVSTSFLICWISGDFANLVGCLLTRALPFQVCLAAYYCFIDLILAIQFWYYTKVYPNQTVHHNMLQSPNMMRPVLSNDTPNQLLSTRLNRFEASPHNHLSSQRSSSSSHRRIRQPRRSFIKKVLSGSVISSTFKRASGLPMSSNRSSHDPVESTKSLLACAWSTIHSIISHIHYSSAAIGVFSGWVSTCLYLTSRMPQILKNFHSKSTKGISPFMFAFAFTGNSLYTVSILSDLYLLSKYDQYLGDIDYRSILHSQLPFVVGSAGTVFSDAIILIQFWIYRETSPQRKARGTKTPLQRATDPTVKLFSDDNFTEPEWYTNVYGNKDSRENDQIFDHSEAEVQNGTSQHRKPFQEFPSVYEPDESSSLLHNSYLNTPPSHYVSSLNRKSVQPTKQRRGIPDTFNAMARSFTNTSGVRSPSIVSSNGSVSNSTGPGTSLIPSLVGTYSSLSKRMLDESKVPFSPTDFLHADYLHQNDGSAANHEFKI